MEHNHKAYSLYERFFKRIVDILFAFIIIILFWWLYIALFIVVKIKLGSPVIFTQNRPGKGGEIFKLYKFRSMTDETDGAGRLLSDKQRITKFGDLLRRSSLDELPEIFNILKGDMSLVGPRPLLVEYLPFYTKDECKRHDVKPGLTGLAQVKGRNLLSWEERFRFDIQYVEKITFIEDVKILLMTLKKVLNLADVSSKGEYIIQNLDSERNSRDEDLQTRHR